MTKLAAQIARKVGRALIDYGMIEDGDRVAVAVSGGKDSLTLLDLLLKIRERAPVRFDLLAVLVDQGYEGFRWSRIETHFRDLRVPYHIQRTRIADAIEKHKDPGTGRCSLCARFRRGVLYRLGREMGWSKIALGHHADDLVETLLLSLLFSGTIKSMPPILRADDGVNVVIRPLCHVWEDEIIAYAGRRGYPTIGCPCVGCADLNLKRQRIKGILKELEASYPGIKRSLLRAQSRVMVTQLMDPRFLPLGRDAKLRAPSLQAAGMPGEIGIVGEGAAAGGASCRAECSCGPLLTPPAGPGSAPTPS